MKMPELKNIMSNIISTLLFFLIFTTACNNSPKAAKDISVQLPSKKNLDKPAVSSVNTKALSDSIRLKLLGKWQRTDGGYIIEIFSVTKEGKMDAGYFNPNPINVDKAEWVISDNKLYIRVILKDVNYPGSTYTLIYYPENDTMAGNYFQAVEKTNYDVIFSRKK
jgi:hypothetical protein